MSLNIPDKHKELLLKFSQLTNEQRVGILNYLDSDEIFNLGIEDLIDNLNSKFEDFDIDFPKLVEVIFSMSRSIGMLKVDKKTFVDEVISSISDDGNLKNDIREDLIRIFDSSLALSSKAIDLLLEGERALSTTRIITDLRPIFNEEKEAKINAGVILHTLKISYKDSKSSDNEFYVQLDSGDLQTLKDQISRAEIKERQLKDSIRDVIKIIDPKL